MSLQSNYGAHQYDLLTFYNVSLIVKLAGALILQTYMSFLERLKTKQNRKLNVKVMSEDENKWNINRACINHCSHSVCVTGIQVYA